jgi:hypothetical protein
MRFGCHEDREYDQSVSYNSSQHACVSGDREGDQIDQTITHNAMIWLPVYRIAKGRTMAGWTASKDNSVQEQYGVAGAARSR